MGRASYSRSEALAEYVPTSVAEGFLLFLKEGRHMMATTVNSYAACVIRILKGLKQKGIWNWEKHGYVIFASLNETLKEYNLDDVSAVNHQLAW